MSQSYLPKLKATWTPAFHEIFIDCCLEQTLNGNKPKTHFTKDGWINIVESFSKKAGVQYEKKQLKNHWDITKEQWKIWCKLISDPSMKWDQETNKLGASDEDWTKYVQANPEAAQFRFKELQHTEKLEILFDGMIDASDMDSLTERTQVTAVVKPHGKNGQSSDFVTAQSTRGTTIVSEQSMSSMTFPKQKTTWTPAFHKMFIDLCLEQTIKGNKPGTHFTKEGWRNIVESVNKKSGLSLTRIQIKNHWDITKEQWKIWCKLTRKSGMKWDPNTNNFGASEDDWINYIQANPEAALFRYKQLEHTDKLEIIFDGTINSGETEASVQHRRLNDSPINTGESEPCVQRRRLNDSSASSLLRTTAKPDGRTECLYDAIESRNAAIVHKGHSTQDRVSYSIGECIECLDGMEEVEQGSELYLFALDVFLKKEYREVFLQLKKPCVKIAWLQRLKSTAPPLH